MPEMSRSFRPMALAMAAINTGPKIPAVCETIKISRSILNIFANIRCSPIDPTKIQNTNEKILHGTLDATDKFSCVPMQVQKISKR